MSNVLSPWPDAPTRAQECPKDGPQCPLCRLTPSGTASNPQEPVNTRHQKEIHVAGLGLPGSSVTSTYEARRREPAPDVGRHPALTHRRRPMLIHPGSTGSGHLAVRDAHRCPPAVISVGSTAGADAGSTWVVSRRRPTPNSGLHQRTANGSRWRTRGCPPARRSRPPLQHPALAFE